MSSPEAVMTQEASNTGLTTRTTNKRKSTNQDNHSPEHPSKRARPARVSRSSANGKGPNDFDVSEVSELTDLPESDVSGSSDDAPSPPPVKSATASKASTKTSAKNNTATAAAPTGKAKPTAAPKAPAKSNKRKNEDDEPAPATKKARKTSSSKAATKTSTRPTTARRMLSRAVRAPPSKGKVADAVDESEESDESESDDAPAPTTKKGQTTKTTAKTSKPAAKTTTTTTITKTSKPAAKTAGKSSKPAAKPTPATKTSKPAAKTTAAKPSKPAAKTTATKPSKPDAKTTTAKASKAAAKTFNKRKAVVESDESEESNDTPAPPSKKAKTATAAKPAAKASTARKATAGAGVKKTAAPKPPVKKAPAPPAPKKYKKGRVINHAPTTKLHVFVFGEGSSGELGLGAAKGVVDVKRPRLNPHLAADQVGVVHVAVGGMHAAALTHDNKILTWGVNDQGALGRDTAWDAPLRSVDDSDSDSERGGDSGLNPREATPTAIPSDAFPEGVVFTQLAAGDSCTYVLTDDGRVWGWGTFRSNEGILGFTEDILIQRTPMLIPELKQIRRICAGTNHVLALTEKGTVVGWGSGQQNQLGRRLVERTRKNGLVPREIAVPRNKIRSIGTGAYHSFAVGKDGKVWAWGLNSFGETGVRTEAGENSAAVLVPTVVESLSTYDIVEITGGSHHSLAVTSGGDCLVWGRVDGYQTGIKVDTLPEASLIRDQRGTPRILLEPVAVPGLKAKTAAAGSDNAFLITEEGKAYSWGFSANYQCGQGSDDDVEVATLIDNTAVRGKVLNWAGAGGQFSILTGPAVELAGGP